MTKRQRDVTEGLLGDSGLMLSPFPVATAGSESDGEDDDARDEEGNDGDEDFANDEEDDDEEEGDGDGDEGADDGRARGELTEEQRDRAEELTRFMTALHQPAPALVPGDLVRWKPGMRDSKVPKDNQQVVVMETFPAYVSDKRGACDTGFREPVDVRLAYLEEDDDVRIFAFDSRRFEKVPASELK